MAVREATGNIVDSLSQSENPKHRNSKFLKFLLKLNHGAYEMKDDQLVKNPEKIAEFRDVYTDMRNKWQKEEVARKQLEEEKKDGEEADQEPDPSVFRNILEGKEELTDDKMGDMMRDWMQEAGQAEEMNKMMQAWGNAWDEDYELKMQRDPNRIAFAPQNPYMEVQQSSDN